MIEHLELSVHDAVRFCVPCSLGRSPLILAPDELGHLRGNCAGDLLFAIDRNFLAQRALGIGVQPPQTPLHGISTRPLKESVKAVAEVRINPMLCRHERDHEVVEPRSYALRHDPVPGSGDRVLRLADSPFGSWAMLVRLAADAMD